MEETHQKSLKTIIIFILLIQITYMQNLFCNGDFQTYQFNAPIYTYFQYKYRVIWSSPDKCWDQIGCYDGVFQVQNLFNYSSVTLGTKMAQLNCMVWGNSYKLCQHVVLQRGRYYNYQFQFFLHPKMISSTVTVYLNSHINLQFLNVTKKRQFQALLITNVFQANAENISFCVDSAKWIWQNVNYTKYGLGPSLDNFKLTKVPYQTIPIQFSVSLSQNNNQIQFIPSADVNSTLLKLALMKNNSYIILNGKNYSDFSYQIYEGTITKIYSIKNQSTLIQQISIRMPGILASTNLQIQFNISLQKSLQNSLYFALDSYHGISWLYFKILSSFKLFGHFYFYGINPNTNSQEPQVSTYWRSKQAHVGFIILIIIWVVVFFEVFCFILVEALKKLCGKKNSKGTLKEEGKSKSQMHNSSRALSSSKRGGDSQYYGTQNLSSSKIGKTHYNASQGLGQSKKMTTNYNTQNNASQFATQTQNYETNYDNQYYGTQNLSQSKRANSQYQSSRNMSASKKENSQYYKSKAPDTSNYESNYDNQCYISQAPGQSQYY